MNFLYCALFILLIISPVFAGKVEILQSIPVAISRDGKGIGFDDLVFSAALNKVIVPGGRTGKIFLIDPKTKAIIFIEGLMAESGYKGGHGEGTTSADEGDGFLFAIDRNAMLVDVIDPAQKRIILSTALAHKPDYVRYVKETNEVWVTEPGSKQIEFFIFSSKPKPMLARRGFIDVPGGPESLVVDHARQLAYTHLWKGQTEGIDLHTHKVVKRWPNGCLGSRGIALDEKQGFLFAGCAEGKAVVLDMNKNGKQVASLLTSSDIDVIGYNPELTHLYLSGNILSVLGVSGQGGLSLLGTGKAAEGSHCAAGDNQGNVWVCDPQHGQLLLYKDKL